MRPGSFAHRVDDVGCVLSAARWCVLDPGSTLQSMSKLALRGFTLFACAALPAFPGTLHAQAAGEYPQQAEGDTQEIGGDDDYADTDPSALTDFHTALDSARHVG